MAEEPSRVSQAGLVLFHALAKMSVAKKEKRRGKTTVPSLLNTDIEEDPFEEADTAYNGSTGNTEGTTNGPELVSIK